MGVIANAAAALAEVGLLLNAGKAVESIGSVLLAYIWHFSFYHISSHVGDAIISV